MLDVVHWDGKAGIHFIQRLSPQVISIHPRELQTPTWLFVFAPSCTLKSNSKQSKYKGKTPPNPSTAAKPFADAPSESSRNQWEPGLIQKTLDASGDTVHGIGKLKWKNKLLTTRAGGIFKQHQSFTKCQGDYMFDSIQIQFPPCKMGGMPVLSDLMQRAPTTCLYSQALVILPNCMEKIG